MIRWMALCAAISMVAHTAAGMDLLATTAISGRAQAVVLVGDYAYCADQYGLWVLDVSDPQTPSSVSHWGSPGLSNSLAIYQSHIYLCDGENGLAVLDASDPAAPDYLSLASGIAGAVRAEISGSHLFVATGSDGLAIMDLSDPAAPDKIGEYIIPAWSSSLAASTDLLVLGSTDSLRLLEVSDPTNPTLLSAIYLPGDTRQLLIDPDSNLLIVLRIEQGISLYDISNAASPELQSTFETGGWSAAMVLQGDTLIVADWFDGISFHDISDPARPEQIGGFSPNGCASGMAVQDNLLALAVGDQGLELWDISDLANPVYQGAEDPEGSPQDAVVWNPYIYEAAGDAGLRVWGIDLQSAQPVAQVQTPGWANAIEVSQNWIYLSDGFGGLRIFDRSPAPAEAFAIATDEYAGALSLNSDQVVYIAQGASGVFSLKLEGLSTPLEYGYTPTAHYIYEIAAGNDFLIACEGTEGFEVFDIADPQSPQFLAAVQPEGGAWCAMTDNNLTSRIYIGAGSHGIAVYDLVPPQSPEFEGENSEVGWVNSISPHGFSGYLWVCNSEGIYYMSANFTPPVISDFYDTPGSPKHITQAGAIVCADDMDLSLFGGFNSAPRLVAAPGAYSLLQAYPNPFNPATRINFALPQTANVSLSVYDLAGRQVANLLSGKLAAGMHEVTWLPNSMTATGAYFVRLETEQQTGIQSILYMK